LHTNKIDLLPKEAKEAKRQNEPLGLKKSYSNLIIDNNITTGTIDPYKMENTGLKNPDAGIISPTK